MTLGDLGRALKLLGWSSYRLAKKMGVPQSRIGRLRAGKQKRSDRRRRLLLRHIRELLKEQGVEFVERGVVRYKQFELREPACRRPA